MPAARVLVPEAAVHLDRGAVPGQHDVGRAGEVAAVQAEAVAHGMQQATHEQLGLCIYFPDRPHDAGAKSGPI